MHTVLTYEVSLLKSITRTIQLPVRTEYSKSTQIGFCLYQLWTEGRMRIKSYKTDFFPHIYPRFSNLNDCYPFSNLVRIRVSGAHSSLKNLFHFFMASLRMLIAALGSAPSRPWGAVKGQSASTA